MSAPRNKIIPATLFRDLAEFYTNRYMAVLPPDITFEDLFQPHMWAHFGGIPENAKFKRHDTVRCIAEDGSFDLDLTVANVEVGSVTMKIRPYFGDKSGDAAIVEANKVAGSTPGIVPLDRDGKPTVRVDHLAATGWRVIGTGGEVSRGHPTKAAAEKAMAEYMKKAHLRFPDPVEPEKELKPAKAEKAA